MNDPLQVAWAAGFLDGEGCFKMGFRCSRYVVAINAVQVEREPLDRLQELFGGSIRTRKSRNENWRSQFNWEVAGATGVARTCHELLPYLVNKRAQARILGSVAETMMVRPGRKGLSDETIEMREAAIVALRNEKRPPVGDL